MQPQMAIENTIKRRERGPKSLVGNCSFCGLSRTKRKRNTKTLVIAAATYETLLLKPAAFATDTPWIGTGGKKKGKTNVTKEVPITRQNASTHLFHLGIIVTRVEN
jgi:hypothetical protein